MSAWCSPTSSPTRSRTSLSDCPTLARTTPAPTRPFGRWPWSMLELAGARLPFDRAWAARKPWTGDQGLTYRENGKVCFAGDTALKDAASADAYETAAKAWAATMPAASVSRLSPSVVDLRSCDPGPAYTHPVPQPSAFKTLGLRSEIIAELQKAGLRYELSACATDALVAKLGVGPLLALNDVTNENDPRVIQV